MEETTKNINYILEDGNLSTEEAKAVVNTLIDNRINTFKIRYMCDWEKDQSLTCKDLNIKIQQLNQRRTELISEIDAKVSTNHKISVPTNLGIVFQK